MPKHFDFASGLFRGAKNTEERRDAIRYWLTDAITLAQNLGEDVAPAVALLSALEGIQFGRVDPILKLPAGRARGGMEAPPAETGLYAIALANIDRLHELGLPITEAATLVAGKLGLKKDALLSKRKHVMVERSKSEARRQRYKDLIIDYEDNRAMIADKSIEKIFDGLTAVGRMIGAI
jgi:hypothetical protein